MVVEAALKREKLKNQAHSIVNKIIRAPGIEIDYFKSTFLGTYILLRFMGSAITVVQCIGA